MARVIRLCAMLTAAALTLSPALAQDFSAVETEAMNHAVIDYALTRPGNYLYDNKGGFNFYLNLQGHDPSAQFLADFGAAATKLKPISAVTAKPSSGPGAMKVNVSKFFPLGPDKAKVFVDAYCGMVCGGQNVVTLQKSGDMWEVTSFTTTAME